TPISSESSGRAVSLSIPAEVPDHPAADVVTSGAEAELLTTNAHTAVTALAGQGACRQPLTHALDLRSVPPPGTMTTVTVLFVAEVNAAYLLDFTRPMLEALNQSIRASGVPVTFEQVHQATTTYQQPCDST